MRTFLARVLCGVRWSGSASLLCAVQPHQPSLLWVGLARPPVFVRRLLGCWLAAVTQRGPGDAPHAVPSLGSTRSRCCSGARTTRSHATSPRRSARSAMGLTCSRSILSAATRRATVWPRCSRSALAFARSPSRRSCCGAAGATSADELATSGNGEFAVNPPTPCQIGKHPSAPKTPAGQQGAAGRG